MEPLRPFRRLVLHFVPKTPLFPDRETGLFRTTSGKGRHAPFNGRNRYRFLIPLLASLGVYFRSELLPILKFGCSQLSPFSRVSWSSFLSSGVQAELFRFYLGSLCLRQLSSFPMFPGYLVSVYRGTDRSAVFVSARGRRPPGRETFVIRVISTRRIS